MRLGTKVAGGSDVSVAAALASNATRLRKGEPQRLHTFIMTTMQLYSPEPVLLRTRNRIPYAFKGREL
jgi:hypothetical protein